jgi:GT2 family glycosyltransferase
MLKLLRPMPAMTRDITVVVPVWNRRDLLARLLSSLRAQTSSIAQLLIVDDASEDGCAEFAERAGARVIRMSAHGGFAKAVNQGIRECRTPLVAIVNNDVELAPDWLERLAATLAPEVWFATGRILQTAARGHIDATFDAVCRGGTPCRIGFGRPDGPAFSQTRAIWSAPMTAALFRLELFATVGLLDERLESYLEDVDFGLRCGIAGCAGRYVPEAVAWHLGSATLGRWHPETVHRTARNQLVLMAKHYSMKMLWRYAWPACVAQGLWGLASLRHGCGWSWLAGKMEALRRFREFRPEPAPSDPAAHLHLMKILRENERDIRRIQGESGWDAYWALYFLLTAGGAK